MPDVVDRFLNMIVVGEGDCWLWDGKDRTGSTRRYSRFAIGHRERMPAHRWSYEHFVGPIPPGLTIDHLCRNPLCVNPAHLEPVTIQENLLRGSNATKTHCVRGHEFTPENTRIYRRDGRVVQRVCRACHREWNAAHRQGAISMVSNEQTTSVPPS